jgi:RNA polymerase sigma factor (sigma-70 family)
MNRVLRHIRRAALLNAGDGPTDAQLLESFSNRRDEAAFEVLLRRHGPMVLGVCRRVLRHAHDAEDAFQATFLVLARKAGALRSPDLLGNWLYGVAHRTALKARAMAAKRRKIERRAVESSGPGALSEGAPDELLARLDTELSRLPEKYRVPVVLCELEGRSRKEVAGQLHIPEGTLSSRLAHAKKLLARRLSQSGAALSAGSVAALLSRDTASGSVPASLLKSTARVAVLTAGAVSARVVELTEGVIKAMLLSKLKFVWAVALAAVVGVGAVGLTYRQAAAQAAPSHAPRRVTADELEELRLEVAALRKGLDVTRERVKALEGQVRTLQGRADAARAAGGQRQTGGPQNVDSVLRPSQGAAAEYEELRKAYTKATIMEYEEFRKMRPDLTERLGEVKVRVPGARQADDPLAQAEAALKRLRANANDKQAADPLERALKQLKDRERAPEAPRAGDRSPGQTEGKVSAGNSAPSQHHVHRRAAANMRTRPRRCPSSRRTACGTSRLPRNDTPAVTNVWSLRAT